MIRASELFAEPTIQPQQTTGSTLIKASDLFKQPVKFQDTSYLRTTDEPPDYGLPKDFVPSKQIAWRMGRFENPTDKSAGELFDTEFKPEPETYNKIAGTIEKAKELFKISPDTNEQVAKWSMSKIEADRLADEQKIPIEDLNTREQIHSQILNNWDAYVRENLGTATKRTELKGVINMALSLGLGSAMAVKGPLTVLSNIGKFMAVNEGLRRTAFPAIDFAVSTKEGEGYKYKPTDLKDALRAEGLLSELASDIVQYGIGAKLVQMGNAKVAKTFIKKTMNTMFEKQFKAGNYDPINGRVYIPEDVLNSWANGTSAEKSIAQYFKAKAWQPKVTPKITGKVGVDVVPVTGQGDIVPKGKPPMPPVSGIGKPIITPVPSTQIKPKQPELSEIKPKGISTPTPEVEVKPDDIEIMRRQKREELENEGESLKDRIIRKEKEVDKLKKFNEEAEDIDDFLVSQDEIAKLTREIAEDKDTFEMMKEKYEGKAQPKPSLKPEAPKPPVKEGNLFPSKKPGTCGECATKSILNMFGKDTDIKIAGEDGTSPRKITATLNERGIETEIKDNIAYDSITPQSIVYYPKADHYVTVESVTPDKITVNDSDFGKPQELSRKEFEGKWLDTDKKGYIIETTTVSAKPSLKPEAPKDVVSKGLVEEARKYKSAEEFVKDKAIAQSLLPTEGIHGPLAKAKFTGKQAKVGPTIIDKLPKALAEAQKIDDVGGDGKVGIYSSSYLSKKIKNGRITVYHGTTEKVANELRGNVWSKLKDGSYLSLTKGNEREVLGVYGAGFYKDLAKKYGVEGEVLKFEIPIEHIGVDQVTGELRFINPKENQSTSQLTDIWKKTHKPEAKEGVGKYQHILHKGTDIEKLKKEGFKSGIGPNVLLRWSGKPTDIMQKKYKPRKGDKILYVPKEWVKDTPNGPKIKDGFIPKDENIVEYEPTHKPTKKVVSKGLVEEAKKYKTAEIKEKYGIKYKDPSLYEDKSMFMRDIENLNPYEGGFNMKIAKHQVETAFKIWKEEGPKKVFTDFQQEATKYKSSDEFIKAQGNPLYHGTSAEFDKFDISKAGTLKTSDWGTIGIYFDPNKSGADYYRKEALRETDKKSNELYKKIEDKAKEYGTTPMISAINLGFDSEQYKEIEKLREEWIDYVEKIREDKTQGRIIEAYIDPKAKVYKHIYTPDMITDQYLADYKLGEGYDVVEIWDRDKETGEQWLSEVIVMNPKVIKTKSELTDIWNEAPKPDLTQSIEQAKAEGKSFEEFVEGQGIVYHGTAKEFDEFKGDINWFTDNKEYAKAYSKYREGDKPTIKEAVIDKSNLMDFGFRDIRADVPLSEIQNRITSKIGEMYSSGKIERDIAEKAITNLRNIKGEGIKKVWEWVQDEKGIKEVLQGVGYKGIVAQEQGNTTYGIFDTSQVKTTSQLRSIWEGTEKPVKKEDLSILKEGKKEGVSVGGEKPKQKEPSRVTVDELEKSREKYGLAELSVDESKKWVNVFNQASTKTFESTSISNSIHKKPRVLTNEEFAILALRKAELEDIINKAEENASKAIDKGNEVERDRYSGVSATALSELDTITESLRFSNREAGRALNIIKVALEKEKEQYKIAKILQKAKLAKGKTLTQEEIAKFQELAQKIKVFEQKESDLTKQIEVLEEQLSKKDAEYNFVKTVKGKARKVKTETLTKERDLLFEQLSKIGYRLNDITGVTYESAKIISQLSVNYFQSGIKSVEKIAEEITNKLPGVTKKDVYDSLGGRIKRTKKIVISDTKRQIIELKKQARLLGQIEDAYKGIFDKADKKHFPSSKVASLKKKLKELKDNAEVSVKNEERLKEILMKIDSVNDQIDRGVRINKKKQQVVPEDIKQAKQDLSEARRLLDTNSKIIDLENQLKTGEFKVPVKVKRVIKRADLLEAQVKLSQLRREVREHIHRLRPRTGREIFVDIVSLPRELMATADFSAAGRQAAILSALNPIKTLKILKQSLPAFFKQNKADEIDVLIKQHENHETRIKAGLKIKSLENIKFSDREEYFLSSLGEKIPVYGHVVKASNRHMVSHLNLIRVMAFDRFLDSYPDATDEELKNWANYVNIASGIGDMGAFNKVASELSVGFFSPRFSTSRIQMPYEVFKYRETPRVRKEIAKNYMKFVGIVGLALWLADLCGAEVELNPESPDWLKIKIGNTRIDLWGGLQQPARLTILYAMKTLNTTGVLKMGKNIDLYNTTARFIRYKLAPFISFPLELMQGKSAIGEKTNPIQSFTNNMTPMVAEDIYETYKSNPILGIILAPFILLGVGVNTYEYNTKKKKSSQSSSPLYQPRSKSKKVNMFFETVREQERRVVR